MFTIFMHSMRRSLGAMFGWGLSLGLLGYFLMGFYDTIVEQKAQLEMLLTQFPPEMMGFFGGADDSFFTPAGFLTLEFFSYMPLVIGIFAVISGSGLLTADEEAGILDLTLAHPISRTALFFGRLLAFVKTLAGILLITWLAFVLGIPQSKHLELTALELLYPFLSLFAILFLFGTLSLLLSMLLPSRGLAGMVGGLILTASYFIQSLSGLSKNLENVAEYLPLKYYQSGEALNGLNFEWLFALLGFGILFALLAWVAFLKRDIRVSGEGNWRLPLMFAMKKK